MFKTLFLVALIGNVGRTFAEETTPQGDKDDLTGIIAHKVVPDVIDVAPLNVATVTYDSGVFAKSGNVLTPTQTMDAPTVTYEADENKLYTLLMIDLDAPSLADPKLRSWHHWLVVNIPGNKVAEGETLAYYIGAGPSKGSGLHRYVFLVFEQPGKLEFMEERRNNGNVKYRPSFSVREFSKKYNLGNPVAGNLFKAEWDEYVPKLYAKLSVN